MKINRKIFCFFVLLALALVPFVAHGQVTKGSISGTVLDQSSAVVTGAQVKATGLQTGVVIDTITDKSGNFRFSLINPGAYKVRITKPGFSPMVVNNVTVNTGQDSGMGTIVLAVAGVSATVEVTDTYTPLIETTQAQVTTSFDNVAMQQLSGISDDVGLDNLALLTPGVNSSRDNNFSNTNGASFDVNGLRGRNNDQQIDGQNNNDNSVAGPALQVSDSEFVGEYQIITNNFGPEYGRNAGSVVDIVTKSGTNNIHGSMYGTENNSNLNTLTNEQKRFDQLTKVPRANTEFAGFTLGAPIVKNQLFFFEGFDEQIFHADQALGSSSLTPTPTGLAQIGACAGISPNALTALDKYSPYAFPQGNPGPNQTLLDNVDIKIGSTYCQVELGDMFRMVPEYSHTFNWLSRVDYQHNKDSVTLRYILQRNNFFDIPDNGPAGWFYNEPALAQAFKAGWTRQLSDHMVNELSGSYARINVQFGGSTNGSDPSLSNMGNAVAHVAINRTTLYDPNIDPDTGTHDSIGSGNALGYGTGTSLPQGRIVNTWQVQDNFNYELGNHHLKAGVNWTYQRSPNEFLPDYNGAYTYPDWGSYLADAPTSPTVQNSATIAEGIRTLDFREYDTFMYAGDDWKVTPNLILNIGLTYSLYGQPANLFHANDVKLQSSSNPLWDTTLPLSVTTFPTLPSDNNSYGPSAGFAWTPGFLGAHGDTVLRGGYRMSYDPPFYNIYLNIASSSPQVFLQTISGLSGSLPSNPIGSNVRSALSSYLQFGVNDPRTFAETLLTPDFKADRVQSWSFGIQRQLGRPMVIEARYVGNRADRLFQSINENPFIAGLADSFPGQIPSGITVAGNGRVIGTNSLMRERTNTGYSDYNGVQTELRADNLFHQMLLRASYTFSKTTDNVSEIFSTTGAGNTSAFSQNPLNYTNEEHALSGLDTPHNLTLTFVEQIPAFKDQRGFVGHLLGGWAVSGNYFIASGQPYTPIQYYFDYYGGGSGVPDYSFNSTFIGIYDNLRPFQGSSKAPATQVGAYAGDVCAFFGGASCDETPTELISYNTAEQTGDGTVTTVTKDKVRYIMNSVTAQQVNNTPWGNTPRNAGRDYWTNYGNASFMKNIKLRSNMKASIRADFTNVFNHPNFESVDPFLEDAGDNGDYDNFGDPSATATAGRTVVLGATIRF